MERGLVSVIIPVYKVEEYLPRCVHSVLAQSYQNIEIILVDDGSPDGCGALCDRFAAIDSRIQVVHKENGGISSARNAGIHIATGEYICFVDSDDWVSECFVERLVYAIESTEADLAACDFQKIDREEKIRDIEAGKPEIITEQKYYCALIEESYAGYVCNKLFRISILRQNELLLDEKIFVGEDLVFTVEYLKYSEKVAYLKEGLYYYFSRPDSMTSSIRLSKRHLTVLDAREAVLRTIQEENPENTDIVISSYLSHLTKTRFLLEPVKKDWEEEYQYVLQKIKEYRTKILLLKQVSLKDKAKLCGMCYLPKTMGYLYRKLKGN